MENINNDGTRLKNASSGVMGAFGMGDTGGQDLMGGYRGGQQQNPYFPKLA